MRHLNYHFLSEFGIDQGDDSGRFNSLAEGFEGSFNDYWWGEICRLDDYLNSTFRPHEIFVSDHVPLAKLFVIWPEALPRFDDLCEACLDYLQTRHPDAAVIMAAPLGSPMPSGRMVLTTTDVWVEQDIAWWITNSAREQNISLPGFDQTSERLHGVNLERTLSWLADFDGERVNSEEFWRVIYSFRGLAPMTGDDHRLGRHIADRILQSCGKRKSAGPDPIHVSATLPNHRVIKIECALEACDRELVQRAVEVVHGIDDSWAVRFSTYEQLTLEDSYRGSLLVNRTGEFVIEAGV